MCPSRARRRLRRRRDRAVGATSPTCAETRRPVHGSGAPAPCRRSRRSPHSSARCSFSTSSSTATMLQTEPAEPGVYAPERPRPAGEAATGVPYRARRQLSHGGLRRRPARQRAPAPRRRAGRLRDRPRRRSRTPSFSSSSPTAAITASSGARGLRRAPRAGWERPLYWTDDGRVRRFDRVEVVEPALPATRLVVRGRRLRALARGADRGRVGAGRRNARRDRAGTSTSSTSGPARQVRSWGTAGSGPPRTSAATRAFPPSVPRVLGGLRAGAGAARRLVGHSPRVARTTFRNWDHPERRQLFAGFRLAWSC